MEQVENGATDVVATVAEAKRRSPTGSAVSVALETHIEEALRWSTQAIEGRPERAPGGSELPRHGETPARGGRKSAGRLRQHPPGNPIIKAGSAILGKAAGVVDMLARRQQQVDPR